MVATGLKSKGGVQIVQMKNSYADDPSKPGKIQLKQLISAIAGIDMNHRVWPKKYVLLLFEIQKIIWFHNIFCLWNTLRILINFELIKDVYELPFEKTMEMFFINFQSEHLHADIDVVTEFLENLGVEEDMDKEYLFDKRKRRRICWLTIWSYNQRYNHNILLFPTSPESMILIMLCN